MSSTNPLNSGPNTGVRSPDSSPRNTPGNPQLNHLAWVWQFTQDGVKEEISRVLGENGLGVVLKTHDGLDWMADYDYSEDAVSGPEQVAKLAAFFEDRGVPFHAWCVVKGNDPKAEASMASEVLAAGARSIALDLEAHSGFWVGSSQGALEFGKELRRLRPNDQVITSIDARPWEIGRIPLLEFSTFSDAIAPQVYWSSFRTAPNVRKFTISGYPPPIDRGVTPQFLLDVTADQLEPFGLPLHPIGDGTRSNESEWEEFIETSYAVKAEAISVWRYGVATPNVWRILGNNPPIPHTYVIQSGDSLQMLADSWGTTVLSITDLNRISNPNIISIGSVLQVPRGTRESDVPFLYTVQEGDSLIAIAGRFNTTVSAIVELNGVMNPDLLRVGEELSIPRGAVLPLQTLLYRVEAGDNLTEIGMRFNANPSAIAELNGIVNPNLLSVGQKLSIPRETYVRAHPIFYTVERGDNLTVIAAAFGTTVDELVLLNDIRRPGSVWAGTQLRVR